MNLIIYPKFLVVCQISPKNSKAQKWKYLYFQSVSKKFQCVILCITATGMEEYKVTLPLSVRVRDGYSSTDWKSGMGERHMSVRGK